MKVILRSPFSPWSGYGRDGIGLAQALLDRHHDVALSPSAVYPPLPRDVAGLLCEPVGHADVALHHIEPHLAKLGQSDARMSRRNILWTMWGFQRLPDAPWVESFAEDTQWFDHIVVYDPDSLAAFGEVVPKEDFELGFRIQKGLESGAYAAMTFGRNEWGNQHHHASIDGFVLDPAPLRKVG